MIFDEIIPRHHGVKLCISREDYDAFCDGNKCAGMLISFFEYWHKIKLSTAYKRKSDGITTGIKERDLWQNHSLQGLVDGIRGNYQRVTIAKAITLLIDKNVLKTVRESDYNRRKATTYLFIPEPIKAFVDLHFSFHRLKIDDETKFHRLKIDTTNNKSKTNNIDTNVSMASQGDGSVVVLKRRNNIVKPTEPIIVKPTEPIIVKPTEPIIVKPTEPIIVKPTEPIIVKPTLVRRKKSNFPSNDIQELFLYWGEYTEFTSHKEDPQSTTFKTIIAHLERVSKKYTTNQIMDAMDNYNVLITSQNTLLQTAAPGHRIKSLSDFFRFSDRLKDAIKDNTVGRKNILEGMKGWFEESLKGIDYLRTKFEKPIKCLADPNPAVTLELEKVYRAKINPNPITSQEHNSFILASQRLVDWHRNMSPKINFSSCPAEKGSPRAFAYRMIDAILDNVQDKFVVKPNWLPTDNQFNDRLTNYMKKLGMLDTSHRGQASDLMTEGNKQQKQGELDTAHAKFIQNLDVVYASSSSEEAQRSKCKKIKEAYLKEKDTIIAKYGSATQVAKKKVDEDEWIRNIGYD